MAGSNAAAIRKRYRERINALDYATMRGLRNAAIKVDREQVKNLSGIGAPQGYPVPVRKGTLRGGHGFAVPRSDLAQVYNTTAYAAAIHSGEMKTAQGVSYAIKPRPFLDDAAETVNPLAEVQKEVRKAWAVGAISL